MAGSLPQPVLALVPVFKSVSLDRDDRTPLSRLRARLKGTYPPPKARHPPSPGEEGSGRWACQGGSNEACEGQGSCREVRSPGGQEQGGTGMTAGTETHGQPSLAVARMNKPVLSHSA